MKTNFENKINDNLPLLVKYVPVVNKVHGPLHPEFLEVKETFDLVNQKINNNDFELNNEFIKLREITNNYLVPNDVCETYEAVYNMLEELDNSYNS